MPDIFFIYINYICIKLDVFRQVSLYSTNAKLLTDEGIRVLSLQLREFL